MLKIATFDTTRAIIPKTVTKGEDLIIIPCKEYERLLAIVQDKIALAEELNQALQEVEAGKIIGPFNTVSELKSSLEE